MPEALPQATLPTVRVLRPTGRQHEELVTLNRPFLLETFGPLDPDMFVQFPLGPDARVIRTSEKEVCYRIPIRPSWVQLSLFMPILLAPVAWASANTTVYNCDWRGTPLAGSASDLLDTTHDLPSTHPVRWSATQGIMTTTLHHTDTALALSLELWNLARTGTELVVKGHQLLQRTLGREATSPTLPFELRKWQVAVDAAFCLDSCTQLECMHNHWKCTHRGKAARGA